MKNKGFSLMELLVYIGLSSVVGLIAYSVMRVSHNMVKSSTTFSELNEARSTILQTFKNESAMQKTMAYSANATIFSCLNNKTDCKNAGGSFTLVHTVNGTDVPLTWAARPGTQDGISPKGAYCTSYDTTNGNDACPFRFVVSWAARCPRATPFNPNPACINPAIELYAKLERKSQANSQANSLAMNIASYNILYVKQNTAAGRKDTCSGVGGVYNETDNTCTMPYIGTQCPATYFVRGFRDGKPVCQHLRSHSCAHGEVLLGVDDNGIAQCGPGCSAATYSSGSIWE